MGTTSRQHGVSKKLGKQTAPPRKTKVPGRSKSKGETAITSPIVERRGQISDAPMVGTHVLFLVVGESRELITIHPGLLPDLTKTYIEERNVGGQIYQLPDEDADILKVYRLFLYMGKVYSITEDDQDMPDNGRSAVHGDKEWMRLAHCYIFASTVKDEKFANASIDAIIEKTTTSDRYPTGIASEVYSYIAPGDNFPDLLVDVHVWKGRGTWVKPPHDDADAPVQFLQDVITGLATAGAEVYEDEIEMRWEEAPCAYYHVHDARRLCRR